MSLEDQVRMHEEWLRSIDSNLDRVTAALARMAERQDAQEARQEAHENRLAAVEDALAIVARNQADFAAAMVSLTRRVDQLSEGVEENRALHRELAAQHARLEQAFEQYLRSQTNGRQN